MTENVEGLFVFSHSEALLEYGKYCVVFALAADGQWTDGSNLIPEHGEPDSSDESATRNVAQVHVTYEKLPLTNLYNLLILGDIRMLSPRYRFLHAEPATKILRGLEKEALG